MPTESERAQAYVESTRAQVDAAIEESIDGFQKSLAEALDALIEGTVIDQPEVTEQINPADLGMLKFNVMQSRQISIDSVPKHVRSLDVDKLAEKVEQTTTGGTYVEWDRVISPFLTTVGDQLKHAGYTTSHLGYRGQNGYDIKALLAKNTHAGAATHKINAAIEIYGKAIIQRDIVDTIERKDRARAAWDQAQPK